jgi:DNA repair protein RecO (recombination protein O)
MLPVEKTALLCGFYLNELLVKLLARDDPHPKLFDHYVATLNELAHGEPAQIALRKFERALLKETGVAADLTRDTGTRAPVEPDGLYVVDPERGRAYAGAGDTWPVVSGKTLIDMERRLRRPADAGAEQAADALPAGPPPGWRAAEYAPDFDRFDAALERKP